MAAVILLLMASCSERKQHVHQNVLFVYDQPCRSKLNTKKFIYDVTHEFRDTTRYSLSYVFCNPELDKDSDVLSMVHDSIAKLERIGKKPDEIIVTGSHYTELLAKSNDKRLAETPVIYMAIDDRELIPVASQRKNFTGLYMDIDIKKNVDFIHVMTGNKFIVTEMDFTPIDTILRRKIGIQLADTAVYRFNYDHCDPMYLVTPSRRDTSRTVITPISKQDYSSNFPNDEVLASGYGFDIPWAYDCQGAQTTFLKLKDDIYTSHAFRSALYRFFTATPQQFNLPTSSYSSACMGGYMTPYNVMLKEVRQIVDSLSAGKKPSDIKPRMHKADYWIDWREFADGKMIASDFPSYVKYVNMPWRSMNRVQRWLWDMGWLVLVVTFLLIMILSLCISFYLRRKEEHKLIMQGEKAESDRRSITDSLAITHRFLWELDGETIKISKKTAKQLGLHRNKISLLAVMRMMTSDDKRIQLKKALESASADKHFEINNIELRISNGVSHTINVSINFIDNGERLQPIGTFMLMDDQLKQQREIRQSLKAEEQSQMREAFLASMGHEIRTPINAIVGFSRLLIDDNKGMDSETKAMCMQQIESNQEQLLELMGDVMKYTAESGQLKSTMITVPAGEMVKEMFRTHSVLVPKHLTFNLQSGEDNLMIHISRTSIRQIISNLINNACKFTKQGGITLGWRAEGDKVCIFVQDTGIGLSKEDQSNIFGLYFKKDHSSEGAGIGLSLCSKLAAAMDGELSVTSELGKGSCFMLTLPIVQ